MSAVTSLLSGLLVPFLALASLPPSRVVAQPLPAVSVVVSADNPACVTSRDCMLRVYRLAERELLQRHPSCIATWSHQSPLYIGKWATVVVTVRCTQMRGEWL